MATTDTSDLVKRLAVALRMWVMACDWASREGWQFRYNPDQSTPEVAEPDLMLLYSCVCLEARLSDSTAHEGVANRVSEHAASMLSDDPGNRLELVRLLKKGYGGRSDFVHGRATRKPSHRSDACFMLHAATHALARVLDLVFSSENAFEDWETFNDHVMLRKFGEMDHLLGD